MVLPTDLDAAMGPAMAMDPATAMDQGVATDTRLGVDTETHLVTDTAVGRPAMGILRTVRLPAMCNPVFPAAPPNRTLGTFKTDAEGWVDLYELPATKISVGAFVGRGIAFVSPRPAGLVPNGQVVTLRCRPGVLIEGKVTLPDGKAAAGARVMVQCEKQGYTVVCGDNGGFHVTVPDVACKISAHLMVAGEVRFHTAAQDVRP